MPSLMAKLLPSRLMAGLRNLKQLLSDQGKRRLLLVQCACVLLTIGLLVGGLACFVVYFNNETPSPGCQNGVSPVDGVCPSVAIFTQPPTPNMLRHAIPDLRMLTVTKTVTEVGRLPTATPSSYEPGPDISTPTTNATMTMQTAPAISSSGVASTIQTTVLASLEAPSSAVRNADVASSGDGGAVVSVPTAAATSASDGIHVYTIIATAPPSSSSTSLFMHNGLFIALLVGFLLALMGCLMALVTWLARH